MEKQDKNALLFIVFFVAGIIAITYWIISEYNEATISWFSDTFNSSLGFKPAVSIAFILTMVVIVILAMVSDGGIFGEIQYVLGAFFVFFLMFTLLIAWLF
ncbi:MAG: hypothetical protein CR974_00375 [Gammaproteobacteria bacterium]|nr:MAG: hypothetical protein CR974_00375 [Gammaproteobacteria bacterium]